MNRCRLDTCTITTDGKCIEGRGTSCPNLILGSSTNDPTLDTEVPDAESARDDEGAYLAEQRAVSYVESEALYPGAPLEISEAREITRRSRATVVTLVGMIESGKTSLLARIHQQFQSGPIGNYEFAGSRTLLRFEEINWLATVESGISKPAMEHTSRRYDNTCLHLAVQRSDVREKHVDLLLNDISGDTYPEAVAAASVCETLLCLHRADHLVVVVDGAAMVDRHRRYDHSAKALEFIIRALQTGQIGSWTILHLIISKLDTFKDQPQDSGTMRAVEALERDFSKYGTRVAEVHCCTASRRLVSDHGNYFRNFPTVGRLH